MQRLAPLMDSSECHRNHQGVEHLLRSRAARAMCHSDRTAALSGQPPAPQPSRKQPCPPAETYWSEGVVSLMRGRSHGTPAFRWQYVIAGKMPALYGQRPAGSGQTTVCTVKANDDRVRQESRADRVGFRPMRGKVRRGHVEPSVVQRARGGETPRRNVRFVHENPLQHPIGMNVSLATAKKVNRRTVKRRRYRRARRQPNRVKPLDECTFRIILNVRREANGPGVTSHARTRARWERGGIGAYCRNNGSGGAPQKRVAASSLRALLNGPATRVLSTAGQTCATELVHSCTKAYRVAKAPRTARCCRRRRYVEQS